MESQRRTTENALQGFGDYREAGATGQRQGPQWRREAEGLGGGQAGWSGGPLEAPWLLS